MMALLIDADGYVLSLAGCLRTLEEAKKINFVEGVRWTETEVGTNAIGTALEIGEAVTIHGTGIKGCLLSVRQEISIKPITVPSSSRIGAAEQLQ